MSTELQRAVRTLWQKCNPQMSEDALDIYFSEIYSPTNIETEKRGEEVVACAQMLERKMTFAGTPIPVGYLTGLQLDPSLAKKEKEDLLGSMLTRHHQRLEKSGAMYSIVVPTDDTYRQLLETCGYVTCSHVFGAEVKVPEGFELDSKITITEEMEWGRDLWIFYAQNGGSHDFELCLTEDDFFAMIERHDLEDGRVLVARRHGKIAGLALVKREGKPLKNGKPSAKTFRVNFTFVLTVEDHILPGFEQKALEIFSDCHELVITGGCPAKGFKNARPHAMVRIISADRFLNFIARRLPGLQLTIGVQGDKDIPENNKAYRLRSGRCYVSEDMPDSIVGPGGIPSMLLAGQLVLVPEI